MLNCKCGKPAHPLYYYRCEDCYIEDRKGEFYTFNFPSLIPELQELGSILINQFTQNPKRRRIKLGGI